MHTNDELPDSNITGRLNRLAAHLDAERAAWDPAITLETPEATPSRRPMLLAAAAVVMIVGGAGLALTPRGTSPDSTPVAAAPTLTQTPSPTPSTLPDPTPGPTTAPPAAATPTPSSVPAPTPSSVPRAMESDDLPPDASPNPDALTPKPCPPTPAALSVPDVVGMTYQDAEAVMTEAGFRLLIAAPGPTDHITDAVITAQQFNPRDIEPCWNVVTITFEPTVNLGS